MKRLRFLPRFTGKIGILPRSVDTVRHVTSTLRLSCINDHLTFCGFAVFLNHRRDDGDDIDTHVKTIPLEMADISDRLDIIANL